MELIHFILSDFSIWSRTVALVYLILFGMADLVKACKRNRKVSITHIGKEWHITVENASAKDIDVAVHAPREQDEVVIVDGGTLGSSDPHLTF